MDPSLSEEAVMDARMVVGMNIHREICALQMSGGVPILPEQVHIHVYILLLLATRLHSSKSHVQLDRCMCISVDPCTCSSISILSASTSTCTQSVLYSYILFQFMIRNSLSNLKVMRCTQIAATKCLDVTAAIKKALSEPQEQKV